MLLYIELMNEGNLFDPTCLERPKIFLRNIKKQEALKIDDFECFLTLDCISRMNELLSGSFLYSYYVKRTRRAAFRMLITKFINQRTAKRLPTIVRRVWLSIIKSIIVLCCC